jgi:hypothetical protein
MDKIRELCHELSHSTVIERRWLIEQHNTLLPEKVFEDLLYQFAMAIIQEVKENHEP